MKKILLKDLAKVIRSKNAGPFETTFDIIFDNDDVYQKVLKSGVINKSLISKLYRIEEDKIITLCPFDSARAIKITIPRRTKQGCTGETDMHSAQQYIPLMMVEVPVE